MWFRDGLAAAMLAFGAVVIVLMAMLALAGCDAGADKYDFRLIDIHESLTCPAPIRP